MEELIIRTATYADWQKVAEIEAICFPAAEAASPEAIQERLAVYPDGCLIAELKQKIIGFINGGATNDHLVEDAFYASMDLHNKDGENMVVFGLDVLPNHQHKGVARQLMNAYITFGRKENKSAILLTCKAHLCDYYASFGYDNLGKAESTHGGAEWYEMRLALTDAQT